MNVLYGQNMTAHNVHVVNEIKLKESLVLKSLKVSDLEDILKILQHS